VTLPSPTPPHACTGRLTHLSPARSHWPHTSTCHMLHTTFRAGGDRTTPLHENTRAYTHAPFGHRRHFHRTAPCLAPFPHLAPLPPCTHARPAHTRASATTCRHLQAHWLSPRLPTPLPRPPSLRAHMPHAPRMPHTLGPCTAYFSQTFSSPDLLQGDRTRGHGQFHSRHFLRALLHFQFLATLVRLAVQYGFFAVLEHYRARRSLAGRWTRSGAWAPPTAGMTGTGCARGQQQTCGYYPAPVRGCHLPHPAMVAVGPSRHTTR